MTGTVIEGRGGFYTVRAGGQSYTLRAQKKVRRQGLKPVIGDEVTFTPGAGGQHGWLEEILPRASCLERPPVANVSGLALVVALVPETDWLLVDKLLVACSLSGIAPLLIVNKVDLGRAAFDTARAVYRAAGLAVAGVSCETGEGLSALAARLSGGLFALAGQSGVGKSTLLEKLTGHRAEAGALSARIARGRQTTRHTTLIEAGGLRLIDTAGFSLLNLDGLAPEALRDHYPDFAPFSGTCRFSPCLHAGEPGCGVRAACDAGAIDPRRLANYRALLSLLREQWRNRYA